MNVDFRLTRNVCSGACQFLVCATTKIRQNAGDPSSLLPFSSTCRQWDAASAHSASAASAAAAAASAASAAAAAAVIAAADAVNGTAMAAAIASAAASAILLITESF